MQAATRSIDGGIILYDAELGGKVHEHVFAPSYWRARDALGPPLGGRGAAWRITTEDADWVLRFYRRGGLPGKLIHDWYFYTGLESSRPWREWRLLAHMLERGLPVPRPVAARVLRASLGYRGAIITATVRGESLTRCVQQQQMTDHAWKAVGRTIRRFHDAGIWHADLNAHNILIADPGQDPVVHLIDFDRGRVRPQDTAWRRANLARLQRSLRKITPASLLDEVTGNGWQALEAGYARDNG